MLFYIVCTVHSTSSILAAIVWCMLSSLEQCLLYFWIWFSMTLACVAQAVKLVWPFVTKVNTFKLPLGMELLMMLLEELLSFLSSSCSGLSSHYCGAALCDVCPCVCWCGCTCAPLGTHYRIPLCHCLVSQQCTTWWFCSSLYKLQLEADCIWSGLLSGPEVCCIYNS